jgi:DNA-binding winged helix-turn-helix (wHTH) protein
VPISPAMSTVPALDEFGLLRLGRHWVSLTELDEAIMRLLLRSFRSPVSRKEILTTAWPERRDDGRVLDTRMHRLRNRIAPLGLTIHTVRRRGFMLDFTPADPDDLPDT